MACSIDFDVARLRVDPQDQSVQIRFASLTKVNTTASLVGRLAPSPTGVLHMGNARTFLLAWLAIRARGGILRLRIEDIDGPRIQPEAAAETIEFLAWLGLDWDLEVWHQTRRTVVYDAAVERLLAMGIAYPCVCSRKEVLEAATAPHEHAFDAMPYPGTCRGRYESVAQAKRLTGRDPAVRFRVDADAVPFEDGFRGAQAGRIAGDFVIRKRDGGPAYQLAVVVDDAAMSVSEVLRGDDLLHSTPRQLLLYRALELTSPRVFHVPLVVGADGRKLSKRHGDTTLLGLRAAGWTAPRMVGTLAGLCGFVPAPTECMPAELLAGFDLARVSRSPVEFSRGP